MSRTTRTLLLAAFGWCVIAAIIWVVASVLNADDGHVRWTIVDVTDRDRSGDAHLLEFPDGEVWMIDAGNKDLWRRSGAPILAERGIDRIDGFILTHGHRNHYEGLLDMVLGGIEVDVVYYTPPSDEVCKTEPWPFGCRVEHLRRLEHELEKAGVNVVPATPGEVVFDDDGVRLTLQHQFSQNPNVDDKAMFTVNNTSIVTLLEAGDTSVLFPGDIGTIIGDYLSSRSGDLDVDIMVAPHHGVAQLTPDSYFDATRPDVFIATMPASLWPTRRAAQLRRYAKQRSLPVYVSGLHGNVVIDIDDDGYRISTEKTPAGKDPAKPQ